MRSSGRPAGFEVSGQALVTAFRRFHGDRRQEEQVTAMDSRPVTNDLRHEIVGVTLKWSMPETSPAVRNPRGDMVARARRRDRLWSGRLDGQRRVPPRRPRTRDIQ